MRATLAKEERGVVRARGGPRESSESAAARSGTSTRARRTTTTATATSTAAGGDNGREAALAGGPKPTLRILETRVLRGANVWARRPVIRMLVDLGVLEVFPSNM